MVGERESQWGGPWFGIWVREPDGGEGHYLQLSDGTPFKAKSRDEAEAKLAEFDKLKANGATARIQLCRFRGRICTPDQR
jgi:hypothetical protein